MKIAHVNNYFRGMHRYVGGAENAAFRTMSIARDQGHDVFAVTLRPDIPSPHCEFRHYFVRRWEDYMPRLMARYIEPVKWYVWQKDRLASADFRRILVKEKPDNSPQLAVSARLEGSVKRMKPVKMRSQKSKKSLKNKKKK